MGNRGLHYWELKETNINLVEGQAEYHFFFRSAADDTSDSDRAQATTVQTDSTIYGMDDVLEATYRTRENNFTADVALTKIDRSTYSALSNKLSTGQPTQYYVQRFIDRVTVSVYPTPDSTAASNETHLYYVKELKMQVLFQMQVMFLIVLYLVWFQVLLIIYHKKKTHN